MEFIFSFILAFQVFKSTSGASKRSGGAGYNSHSESTVVNAIGSRVFGTNRAAVNQPNKPPIIPQQTPFFKTAGTELVCVIVFKLLNLVFHIFSMFPWIRLSLNWTFSGKLSRLAQKSLRNVNANIL